MTRRCLACREVGTALTLALALAGTALLGAACDDKKSTDDRARRRRQRGHRQIRHAPTPSSRRRCRPRPRRLRRSENGPPPDGIFAPGVADKRHPKGAPTTVDMVGDGDEPRITLHRRAGRDAHVSYGPAAIELAMQMGPRMVDAHRRLRPDARPRQEGRRRPDWLVADIKNASPAKEQLGELPPGTDKVIASLEGSQLRLKLTARRRARATCRAARKAAAKELDRMRRTPPRRWSS